jgi:hypothetical protein
MDEFTTWLRCHFTEREWNTLFSQTCTHWLNEKCNNPKCGYAHATGHEAIANYRTEKMFKIAVDRENPMTPNEAFAFNDEVREFFNSMIAEAPIEELDDLAEENELTEEESNWLDEQEFKNECVEEIENAEEGI